MVTALTGRFLMVVETVDGVFFIFPLCMLLVPKVCLSSRIHPPDIYCLNRFAPCSLRCAGIRCLCGVIHLFITYRQQSFHGSNAIIVKTSTVNHACSLFSHDKFQRIILHTRFSTVTLPSMSATDLIIISQTFRFHLLPSSFNSF